MATPLRTTSRTPVPAPTKPWNPKVWYLPPGNVTHTAPQATERPKSGSYLPPAARSKSVNVPVQADDQSRVNRILEQLGVTDKTAGSRNIFNTQKNTATFGDPAVAARSATESRTGPGIKYSVPKTSAAKKAPALNDPTLASKGAAPTVKVVGQSSVYQGETGAGLAGSVYALNTSQEEAAVLQEQWRQRLFDIAFSGQGNVGTDEGLMQLNLSQNALGLLNTSFGGKNTLGGGLDIAGIVRARSEYQTKAAELTKKNRDEGSLRWANDKLQQASPNPWTLENSWERNLRKKSSTRDMEATILGVNPASF